jgi:hypothetical protein
MPAPGQPNYVQDRDMPRVWLYGLSVIFAIGVIILLIMPVIFSKVAPVLLAGFNSTTTGATINADKIAFITNQFSTIRYYIYIAMYAVLIGAIVYMVYVIWNREQGSS